MTMVQATTGRHLSLHARRVTLGLPRRATRGRRTAVARDSESGEISVPIRAIQPRGMPGPARSKVAQGLAGKKLAEKKKEASDELHEGGEPTNCFPSSSRRARERRPSGPGAMPE